jgi:magnesium chelatase subunit H
MKGITNKAERDARVVQFHEQLIEIEQRLIPTGLHVFGRAAELKEKADLLRMVASFDRPEHGAQALPAVVARALGLDDGVLDEAPTNETRELIDDIVAESISRFCQDGAHNAVTYLQQRANVSIENSAPIFALLEKISEQLDANCEIDSLMRALRGEYIAPGPGADIVQNPFVLPTGRNTHAVNPYSVPSRAAFDRAKHTADSLLRRYYDEHGRYPRALALVLWGLDNIKTQGEGVAQALWFLGVRPGEGNSRRTTAPVRR